MVSTSSSFRRSGLCTMLAKSRMVLGSPMSRLKANRAHGQMLLDQPGDRVRLGRAHAEARAQLAGDARALDRMILGAPLGDIVQERRHVEGAAALDGREDLGGQRMRLGGDAALDVGQHADGADQVLVHRVVVVHVELHHRHDLAEVGNEAAEHAGFIHAPQGRLRVHLRAQDLEEDAVGLRIAPQPVVDQAQRAAQQADGGRMEEGAGALGLREEADQVDRIALEGIGVGDVQAAVVDAEIAGRADVAARAPAQRIEILRQARRGLDLLDLERRAQDGGEVADLLGHQEVVLHEALDGAQPAALDVAEAFGHGGLDVEGQPLLGPPAQEMQMAANGPEEVLASAEGVALLRREDRRALRLVPRPGPCRRDTWPASAGCAGRAGRPCLP